MSKDNTLMEGLLDKAWGLIATVFGILLSFFVHNQKKTSDQVAQVAKELADYKKEVAKELADQQMKLSERLAEQAVELGELKVSMTYVNKNTDDIKKSVAQITKMLQKRNNQDWS